MSERYFYHAKLQDFIQESFDSIFSKLCSNDEGDSVRTQKNAWEEEIALLKYALHNYKDEDAWITFEYSLIRLGKRIDAVLLLRERVFVLEFKVGSKEFLKEDLDQVLDYALDLKNFHQTSKDRTIIPILIATKAEIREKQEISSHYEDNIYHPIKTNTEELGKTIKELLNFDIPQTHYEYALINWTKGRYAPTPTIVEAAKALYLHHKVEDITKHEAEGAQLDKTTDCCLRIIKETKERKGKSILFVTGVPGAGKTLVGLNVAIKQSEHDGGSSDKAVYLSGNGPLVEVLTEALARDKVIQEKQNGKKKYTKKKAQREVKQFIQIIHRYRDQILSKTKVVNGELKFDENAELPDKYAGFAEVENIAIFDEAQRSWDREHLSKWLKRKKKYDGFSMSEGEFLIWSLDQRPDWAVIICLVGGGQEINTGEAGIGEWIRALNETFPKWNIYISDQLTEKEYAEGNVKSLLANNKNVEYSEALHLGVSMRSFRAEKVSEMVHYLLEGNTQKAKEIYEELKDKYPIRLTRDLGKAKNWLKEKARGSERYGLIVSSKAARLKPIAIDVRCKPNIVHWFLADKNDVRSSLFLEDAAQEFDVQGLELDYVGLVWDGDLRKKSKGWGHYAFNGGTKWNNVKKAERKAYQLNSYRVLLTRARQGMVICVPKGDENDSTRSPKFYGGTYEYLKSIGFDEL